MAVNYEALEPVKGSNIRAYVSSSKMAASGDLTNQLYAAEEIENENSLDTEDHVFQGMTTKGYIPTIRDFGSSFDIVHTKGDTAFELIKNSFKTGTPLFYAYFEDIETGIGEQCKVIVSKLSTKLAVGGTITSSVELKPALGCAPEELNVSE